MSFASWLSSLIQPCGRQSRKPIRRNDPLSNRRAFFESLEDRRVLAVGAIEMPNYGNLGAENSWVRSPVLNVPTSSLTVQFDSLTLNETGFPTSYDVEWIEYSPNGGASWTALHGSVPALHSSNTFNHVVVSAAVTPSANARVRLRLDTGDGCCGNGGWKVDNVNIGGVLFDFNTGFQGWTTGNNPTTSGLTHVSWAL